MSTNRFFRGCLLLVVATCFLVGASVGLAIGAFYAGWIATPRHAVMVDLGPIWIGDPCKAALERMKGRNTLLISCLGSYTIAVNIKETGKQYNIVSQPRFSH
jgi:hypothetical protein